MPDNSIHKLLHIRHLGLVDYKPTWQAMQDYTDHRDEHSPDQIWFLQHPSVFTQGQAGKAEHVLAAGNIPVIQADRGGQITYHGPGQLVVYLLVDIKRKSFGVRDLVTVIEQATVNVLNLNGIQAAPRVDAPGVYIQSKGADSELLGAKIAQLGLRVRRGCSFHGLSLNVDMDMEPFQRINPCGHVGMEVTSMAMQAVESPDIDLICQQLTAEFCRLLGYTHSHIIE